MDVDPDEAQSRAVTTLAVDGTRLLERHAELVDTKASRDVGMAAGIDVRIDAQRDARAAVLRRRDGRNPIELAGRLGIDRRDACGDGGLKFFATLADTSEDDVSRIEPRAPGHLDFAAGVRVDLAAYRAQQANHRQRRVGLERVVDRVRVRGERLIDRAVRLADGASAVDVSGGADMLDDRFDADVIAREAARRGPERLVHERSHVIMRASSAHRAHALSPAAMPADMSIARPSAIDKREKRCLPIAVVVVADPRGRPSRTNQGVVPPTGVTG